MLVPGSDIDPKTVKLPLRAIVADDFEGEADDELTLKKGTRVVAYQIDDDGWWTVKAAGGLTGIFPGSYLDVVMDDPAPATKAAAPQAPQQLAPAAPAAKMPVQMAKPVMPARAQPSTAPPHQQYVPQATVTSASVVHKPAVVTKPATSTATTVSRGGTPLSASGGGGAIKIASATIYTPPARKEQPPQPKQTAAVVVRRQEAGVAPIQQNVFASRQGERQKEVIEMNLHPERAAALPRPARPVRKPIEELKSKKTTIGNDSQGDYQLTEEGIKLMRAEEGVRLIQEKKALENKTSLNDDNMEWVERVTDNSQRVHALAVVRLYFCKKGTNAWRKTGMTGCAALLSESGLDGNCFHVIRLIDLNAWNPNNSLMMEQEFYEGMEYHQLNNWFHAFEMNNGLAGFSFAIEAEAQEFANKARECLNISARNMIHEDYLSKERAYMYVGDSGWRIAEGGDGNLNKIRKKYAAGGTADGLETTWSKPAAPPELAAALGISNEAPAKNEMVSQGAGASAATGSVDGIRWTKNAKAMQTQKEAAAAAAAEQEANGAVAAAAVCPRSQPKKKGLFGKKKK